QRRSHRLIHRSDIGEHGDHAQYRAEQPEHGCQHADQLQQPQVTAQTLALLQQPAAEHVLALGRGQLSMLQQQPQCLTPAPTPGAPQPLALLRITVATGTERCLTGGLAQRCQRQKYLQPLENQRGGNQRAQPPAPMVANHHGMNQSSSAGPVPARLRQASSSGCPGWRAPHSCRISSPSPSKASQLVIRPSLLGLRTRHSWATAGIFRCRLKSASSTLNQSPTQRRSCSGPVWIWMQWRLPTNTMIGSCVAAASVITPGNAWVANGSAHCWPTSRSACSRPTLLRLSMAWKWCTSLSLLQPSAS